MRAGSNWGLQGSMYSPFMKHVSFLPYNRSCAKLKIKGEFTVSCNRMLISNLVAAAETCKVLQDY